MKPTAFFLLLALSAYPLFADEDQHHEEMTSQQLGMVHFQVSCSASAQESFTRGVALLHSFWYEESEKAFQKAATDDPQCAMAHWGVAMSLWHQLWNHPDEAIAARGLAEAKQAESLQGRTARERGYIAAIAAFYKGLNQQNYYASASAYSDAMRRVYQKYPEDHEAAAFYALSLLASEPEDNPDLTRRKQAAAVLEKLFAQEPDHPGVAHYLIHTYDKPGLAELGLPAARRYAQIAPAAPHALHMPSHIFARLGLWQDDIDSNLASIAASQHSAAMHMGGESHEFHAMDFLVYAYIQVGREADAWRVIEQVKAMPPMKDMYGTGYDPHLSAASTFEAMYPLELHHWADAAALTLVPGAEPVDNAMVEWARAIGAARSGDLAAARACAAEIEKVHDELLRKKKPSPAKDVGQEFQEATAWIDHAEGKDDAAIKILRAIADREDGGSDMSGEIPAHEMLGDLLLEMKRPEQALLEYQTDLKLNPNRFDALYGAGRSAEMLGKSELADTYYAQLAKQCAGSASTRPELTQARARLAGN